MTRTNTRPSNGVRFDTTSGAMAVFEKSGGSDPLDRNIDHREGGQRLRGLPSSVIWKSSLVSVADEVPLRVGDAGVNLDVADFDLEGDGRLGRRLRCRRLGRRPARQTEPAPRTGRTGQQFA